MPRNMPVKQVMTTDVLTFGPDEDIQEARRLLPDVAEVMADQGVK